VPSWEGRIDMACMDGETGLAKVLTQEEYRTTEKLKASLPE
jgi:hypothetical protein